MHTILMSDLDKKLEKIVTLSIAVYADNDNFIPVKDICDDATKKIRQAFIDSRWKLVQERIDIANNHIIDQTYREYGLMTGKEWYDKFEKELGTYIEYGPVKDGNSFRAISKAHEAAKKAAGLE